MTDYTDVTELAGEEVSREQVERLAQRYFWAEPYCRGRDVIEVACGSGPGLGYLAKSARSLRGGDVSEAILEIARRHYGDRVELAQVDAEAMPYEDDSADVVLIFEAIYYLRDVDRFLSECTRVLRTGGHLLIATANPDLYDFSPSAYSHAYYGVRELKQALQQHGFGDIQVFAGTPVGEVSWRQRALRPIKKAVVASGLMPKSMAGKRLLKRLVFGGLVPMPAEIDEETAPNRAPVKIAADQPDRDHKVLYCAASRT